MLRTSPESSGPAEVRNRVLGALPPNERAAALARLERVRLEQGSVLQDVERPVERVYFLESGVAGVLSAFVEGGAVETATLGCEGMIGLAAFHGVGATPEQVFMQLPGEAYCAPAGALGALLDEAPTLRALLHRQSVAMFTVAAQSSACNRKHTVEQRAARWVLGAHQRAGGRDLEVTHAFLSRMLGVRRASVTDALAVLQREGAIVTSRGRITVTDADRLAGAACGCYLVIRQALERVTGEPAGPSPLAGLVTSTDGVSAFDHADVEPADEPDPALE